MTVAFGVCFTLLLVTCGVLAVLEKYLDINVYQEIGQIIKGIEEEFHMKLKIEMDNRTLYDNKNQVIHINKLKYNVPVLLHEIGHGVTSEKKWLGRLTKKLLLPLVGINRLFFYPYYIVMILIRVIDYKGKWCFILYNNPLDKVLFFLFTISVFGKVIWLIYNEISASVFAIRRLLNLKACDGYIIAYFVVACIQQVLTSVFLFLFFAMIRGEIIHKFREMGRLS